jgi:hypothetical protein
MVVSCTYLGHKHQSLPNHESGEYNHCQIEYLKRQLALVGPELFELHHLLVYHILNHVTVGVGFGFVDELLTRQEKDAQTGVVVRDWIR